MENYFESAQKILAAAEHKKLLLHSCCAPCSSSVLEQLMPRISVTVYYYNPNIMPFEEYNHRLGEQRRLCDILGIPLIEGEYDNPAYLERVKGLESCPEGGKRCEECFYMRLSATARLAKERGFDFFCTTLTVSPHKNAEVINALGKEISIDTGIDFLPSDFKKKNGYLRSVELSKAYNLYRQVYCGCRF